jgi:hypothetical protein
MDDTQSTVIEIHTAKTTLAHEKAVNTVNEYFQVISNVFCFIFLFQMAEIKTLSMFFFEEISKRSR